MDTEPASINLDEYATQSKERRKNGREKYGVAYIREFTSNTSLQGLKYIGETNRSLFERIFWSATFILSLGSCIYFTIQLKRKWDSTPVIVTFAETSTPVSEIPFPAVTICSEIKIRQRFFNYSRVYNGYGNRTDEEQTKLEYSSLVCEFTPYSIGNKTIDEEAISFITKASPDITDLVAECRWKSEILCSHYFTPVMTDDGLCHTFNILDSKDIFRDISNRTVHQKFLNDFQVEGWTVDEGYPPGESMDSFPHRTQSSDAKSGLRVFLMSDKKDVDATCRWPVDGFKMFLHNPAEFPRVTTEYFRIPVNRDVVVGIRPNVMTTSKELRSYSPERRQCYFSKERHLHYFQYYNERNCEMECFTNYTIKTCGCAAFYMSHDVDTPICGSRKLDCVNQAEVSFFGDAEGLAKCRCLPACVEIKYDVETSQATFSWEQIFIPAGEELGEFENKTMTRVLIYFKDNSFIPRKRNELFGLTDFISNSGGLLGLFLGFSFLSLIEIIYFLTIRAYGNFRLTGNPFHSP